MGSLQASVDALARRQYGVISRRQAVDIGLTKRQVDHRVAKGEFVSVHQGVFGLRAVEPSWEGRLLAACLSTGGVASHRCAAALWGLELYRHPPVEVTVAGRSQRRRPGIRVHRTSQWERRGETVRSGIPCTGIERTILDCGAVLGWRTVERLAESAIRQRRTSWSELASCLSRHSRRGRDGCGKLRAVLELRLGDHTIPLSDFSRLVANLLEDAGLPSPQLEFRIHDAAGGFIMQADLAWPRQKKIWELDGLQFHFGRDDVERDRRKRNRAIAEGWTIQEILWSMYVDEPEALVAMARKFLAPKRSVAL